MRPARRRVAPRTQLFLLLNADRGYDPSGILTARVSLPARNVLRRTPVQIVHAILDRLATIPTITDAAFTSELPLTAGGWTSAFTLQRPGVRWKVQASPRVASARVFPALGMRIVAGRGFDESDTESAPPVVVVNRAFARRYLNDHAVGSRFRWGLAIRTPTSRPPSSALSTMFGHWPPVTPRSRKSITRSVNSPDVFPVPVVTFLLRTTHDPTTLAGELRAAIRQADDAVVPEGIATMEDRVLTGLARPQLYHCFSEGSPSLRLSLRAFDSARCYRRLSLNDRERLPSAARSERVHPTSCG